jgi:hypothetical protein
MNDIAHLKKQKNKQQENITVQHAGMQDNGKCLFLSVLFFVSIRERMTTAQHSGMQEHVNGFVLLFAFRFHPRNAHYYCAALQDAGKCRIEGIARMSNNALLLRSTPGCRKM